MQGTIPPSAMTQMAEFDVFISYRRKDTLHVRPLVDALMSKDLRVWFDQHEVKDFVPITDEIRKGLARSKALLAWYSVDYPKSRPCQTELLAAFLGAQRLGDPRTRIWIVNPETSAAHIESTTLRDEQFAQAPHTPEEYLSLANRIADLVKNLRDNLEGVIPIALPTQYPETLVSSPSFVGRHSKFWDIHSALHGAEHTIISNHATSGIAQLTGLGGIGKSLLAQEYAVRFSPAYPGGIFWLRALGDDPANPSSTVERQKTIRMDQLRVIGGKLGLKPNDNDDDKIETALRKELDSINQPYLWVVDDLPSGLTKDAVLSWKAPTPLGKTLITTRSREYDEVVGSRHNTVDLEGLGLDEALSLLCPEGAPDNKDDEQAACGIAADLGFHPLALAVCSRSLRSNRGQQSYAQYREALAKLDDDELEFAAQLKGLLPNGHEKSVAATLLRSVLLLGKEGLEFLRLASLISTAPIPPSLVIKTFIEADKLGERDARKRTHLGFSEAESLSLCAMGEQGTRIVHALVSRTVRFKMINRKRERKLQLAIVDALTNILRDVIDVRQHSRLAYEVMHGEAICARATDKTTISQLIGFLGRYHFEQGNYPKAENYQKQVQTSNDESFHDYNAKNDLAQTLKAKGDLVSARRIQETLLKHQETHLGPEHPITLVTKNNLIQTLDALGERDRASSLLKDVLSVAKQRLGQNDPATLTFLSNYGEQLRKDGKINEARAIHEQVLSTRRVVLGNEHKDTLGTMLNLAETFRDLGDLDTAQSLQEEVLEKRTRMLGEAHPDTLRIMANLAETHRDKKNFAKAIELDSQALNGQRRVLGRNHEETTRTEWNLACVFLNTRDYEKVASIFRNLNWLLQEDSRSLGSVHRQIRSLLERHIEMQAHIEPVKRRSKHFWRRWFSRR
jgi:tetratricopeptide (TPR) repeat protein